MVELRKHNITINGAGAHWYAVGGAGPPLHFYHANAYPFGTYRQLAERLSGNFRVFGMAHRATWEPARLPGRKDTWAAYADDLIAFLEQKVDKPVIGAGHSMGGVATMMAALKRPDLFRSLVLIDPVFFPRRWWLLFRITPTAIARRTPYIARAVHRPDRWPSIREGVEFHRSKRAFSRFSSQAMADFGEYGLAPGNNGNFRLAFPKSWEAHIYCNVPYVWHIVKKVRMPVLGIRGRYSDVLLPPSWKSWKRLRPADTFVEISDAGHLAPLERPEQIASIIADAFGRGEI